MTALERAGVPQQLFNLISDFSSAEDLPIQEQLSPAWREASNRNDNWYRRLAGSFNERAFIPDYDPQVSYRQIFDVILVRQYEFQSQAVRESTRIMFWDVAILSDQNRSKTTKVAAAIGGYLGRLTALTPLAAVFSPPWMEDLDGLLIHRKNRDLLEQRDRLNNELGDAVALPQHRRAELQTKLGRLNTTLEGRSFGTTADSFNCYNRYRAISRQMQHAAGQAASEERQVELGRLRNQATELRVLLTEAIYIRSGTGTEGTWDTYQTGLGIAYDADRMDYRYKLLNNITDNMRDNSSYLCNCRSCFVERRVKIEEIERRGGATQWFLRKTFEQLGFETASMMQIRRREIEQLAREWGVNLIPFDVDTGRNNSNDN